MPVMIIITEYKMPEVGIAAGRKFCRNGIIPPKRVNKAMLIVANFSNPNNKLLKAP